MTEAIEPTEMATGMPPDAPSTTVSTTTTASPEELWPLVVDPSTPARFSDELQGAAWKPTDGVEPPGLGARFVGHNRNQWLGDYTTLSTVTVHEPVRRFGWTVQALDDPVSDWLLEIRPTPTGNRVTFTARLGGSPLSGLVQAIERAPDRAAELTEGRLAMLAGSMQRTIEGIAAIAEGRAAPAVDDVPDDSADPR